MIIEHIFTCPPGTASQVEHQSVQLVAGAGIRGDRYYGAQDEPGQNITFVEAEEIERFAAAYGHPLDLAMTRRNVVTRGVRLNALLGQEFTVGTIRFRGVELCEPCMGLGEALASATLSPAQVIKHWLHHAGLRADVLSSGELSVGARFSHSSRGTTNSPLCGTEEETRSVKEKHSTPSVE